MLFQPLCWWGGGGGGGGGVGCIYKGGIRISLKTLKKIIHLCMIFQPLCYWWKIWPMQNDVKKTWKMTETLASGYSSDSTHQELSNAYQNGRV